MFEWSRLFKGRQETLVGRGVNLSNPTRIAPITIPDSYRKRHTMIFGTTGVGKTRLCGNILEQDIGKGFSVVFFDPKGDQEIFGKICDMARKAGRLEELQLITPVYPEFSAVVDPMAFYFMPDELVGHVCSSIPPGKEPFYRNIAKEIMTAVITAIIIIARHEKRPAVLNLDSLRKAIRRKSLEDTMNTLRSLPGAEAERAATIIRDIVDSPPEYYTKVSATLRTALMELSGGNIGKIIGQADSNRFIDRLEAGKRVILVVHTGSMLTREAGCTLGRVLLSMIQSFVGRVYVSGRQKIDPPLSVVIDEAQSVLYPGVEEVFAKAGSANVMVTALAQSVNQLYASIGEDLGKIILDNTNTKLFMRCTDAETAEYVARHFGTHNVLTGIFGTNQVTTREIQQEVVKTQEVLDLQIREFFMTTYSGRWRGTTIDSGTPDLDILFPDSPLAPGNCAEAP